MHSPLACALGSQFPDLILGSGDPSKSFLCQSSQFALEDESCITLLRVTENSLQLLNVQPKFNTIIVWN